jgi:LPXTG-site transpeptidase (sortase) family protein
MEPNIFSRKTLLTITLAGSAIFLMLVVLLFFTPKDLIQADVITPVKSIVASPKREEPNFGLPLRLKIPAISVDADVENVGLTAAGAMDVPKSPMGVGWFDLSVHPGNNGSAVIAGHFGVWKSGEETVFNNLNKLRQGDKVYVEDDKGRTISFAVRESRSYYPKANASEVFSSDDGKPHLNLITCENWDKVTESFSKRLVVFTDKQ